MLNSVSAKLDKQQIIINIGIDNIDPKTIKFNEFTVKSLNNVENVIQLKIGFSLVIFVYQFLINLYDFYLITVFFINERK